MTLSSQIASDVERSIAEGLYRPNDKIPSISETGKKYGVSHITVLRAYRELEAKNLIVSRKGLGNFVKPFHAVPVRTGRIGVFTRPQRPMDPFDNYFNCINIGIETAAAEFRLDILRLHSSAVFNQNKATADQLRSVAEDIVKTEPLVDGFIIDERFPDEMLQKILPRLSKPVVIINRFSKLPVFSVANDNRKALESIFSCARNAGCRHTLFIANKYRHELDPDMPFDRFSSILNAQDIPDLHIADGCQHKKREEAETAVSALLEKLLATGEKTLVLAETEYNMRFFQSSFSVDDRLLLAGMTGLKLNDSSCYAGRFCNSIPDTYAIGKKAVALLGDTPAHPEMIAIPPEFYLGNIDQLTIL